MGHFRLTGLTHVRDHWDEDPKRFLVQLQAEVSRDGEPGGEAFGLAVASPSQLAQELGDEDLEPGRGYVLMGDYDERRLTVYLQGFLDRSGAETWSELKTYVDRHFDWI